MKTFDASKNFRKSLLYTIAVLLWTLVRADIIYEKCIWRTEELGTISEEKFSDEAKLTTEIDQLDQFYAYYECNEPDGSFSFFQLVLADRAQQNRKTLSEVGTKAEDEVC